MLQLSQIVSFYYTVIYKTCFQPIICINIFGWPDMLVNPTLFLSFVQQLNYFPVYIYIGIIHSVMINLLGISIELFI